MSPHGQTSLYSSRFFVLLNAYTVYLYFFCKHFIFYYFLYVFLFYSALSSFAVHCTMIINVFYWIKCSLFLHSTFSQGPLPGCVVIYYYLIYSVLFYPPWLDYGLSGLDYRRMKCATAYRDVKARRMTRGLWLHEFVMASPFFLSDVSCLTHVFASPLSTPGSPAKIQTPNGCKTAGRRFTGPLLQPVKLKVSCLDWMRPHIAAGL